MNLGTLLKIGRHHTPQQIVEAVDMARRIGFGNINMDIIIGLPGEEKCDVENTLKEIARLSPENLTVHTLALKRASKLKESSQEFLLPDSTTAGSMLEITAEAAAEMKMYPYYVGYTKKGYDCIYNIQIIEERQTILGLGGGAGSKLVQPGTWSLTSQYNPKDPQSYIERIDELIIKKISHLKTKVDNLKSIR